MKVRIALTVEINTTILGDPSIRSAPARATFEADISWVPMSALHEVVGTLPTAIHEITIEQVGGNTFRQYLNHGKYRGEDHDEEGEEVSQQVAPQGHGSAAGNAKNT